MTFTLSLAPLPRYSLLLFSLACASHATTAPPPAPAPAPPPPAATFPVAAPPVVTIDHEPPKGLPPIPPVTGAPLKPNVVYPPRDYLIPVRDSNFVVGSVGSGDATLTIDGAPVDVKPNGAFLAWLPIPDGPVPVYHLMVRRGDDSAVVELPVRTWRSELVRQTMRRGAPPQIPAAPPPPPSPRYVMLGKPLPPDSLGDREISVRPVPNGTYKWFAIPGTIVEREGVENGYTRVRLDEALEAYVPNADVVELSDSAGHAAPRRVVGNLTVVPDSAWTDVSFPVRQAPPYLVEEESDKLVVTMYATRGTTDIISYRRGDDLVRAVTWEPLSNERVRYVVHLRQAPFGYRVFFDGKAFVLRVRRPPAIDREHPLRGITIAVDAGHPPAGATGPTGVYEGDVTLPIAVALKEELEKRGATVLMTRTTLGPVDLGVRPIMAQRANAHALVSIHLNAQPDGVNPLTNNGTGTYFFHPHSEPLARAVQRGMVASMGLTDRGVFYDNLALVRGTWMPSVLCEGAFVIVPEQEAAMANPDGQRAYAHGVAAGIEAYFKALGQ